jgi:polar amino acid transport system permease protein
MDILRTVLTGLPLTIAVTFGALAVGTVLALPLTLARRAPWWIVRGIVRIVVDLLRGIPQLVWLFLIYYGVTIGGVRLEALPAGIAALGVVAAGYIAEIFRGAISGVPTGQWEASAALGFKSRTAWVDVVAPQAIRIAIPGYTNYLIALLKDSAIVSIVGVADISFEAGQLARSSDIGLLVYLFAAALYIALTIPMGLLSRTAETKLRAAVKR